MTVADRLRRLARLLLLFATALAVTTATAVQASGERHCRTTAGLESMLGAGQVLLLGEIHGTNEAPEFVATVACHALARGLEVTIALELPTAEEPAVRARTIPIVALPFWEKSYQDGRTSAAMLSLIEKARAWEDDGEDVELILIDDPSDFRGRDRHMAQRVLHAVAGSPGSFFVVLTGNLHSRTVDGSGRMGALLLEALGREQVTSLRMNHAGGSAWICEATAGCGPLKLRKREAEPKGTVRLFSAPDGAGFDGIFSVGPISASLPARGAADD